MSLSAQCWNSTITFVWGPILYSCVLKAPSSCIPWYHSLHSDLSLIWFQILALPIGLAIGKVFHCVLDPQQESFIMYVDNTQQCYGDVQWAYAAGCFAFAILTFKGFAFWLIKKTKKELIFSHASGQFTYPLRLSMIQILSFATCLHDDSFFRYIMYFPDKTLSCSNFWSFRITLSWTQQHQFLEHVALNSTNICMLLNLVGIRLFLFYFRILPGHEAYLQLKETEYAQGLDIVYIISGFHIFSSFKLRAAHFRAANHLLKLVLVLFYASLFNHSLYQVSISENN